MVPINLPDATEPAFERAHSGVDLPARLVLPTLPAAEPVPTKAEAGSQAVPGKPMQAALDGGHRRGRLRLIQPAVAEAKAGPNFCVNRAACTALRCTMPQVTIEIACPHRPAETRCLGPGTYRIGRRQGAILLPDRSVGDPQGELRVGAQGVTYHELGQGRGSATHLTPGQHLRFGDCTVTLQSLARPGKPQGRRRNRTAFAAGAPPLAGTIIDLAPEPSSPPTTSTPAGSPTSWDTAARNTASEPTGPRTRRSRHQTVQAPAFALAVQTPQAARTADRIQTEPATASHSPISARAIQLRNNVYAQLTLGSPLPTFAPDAVVRNRTRYTRQHDFTRYDALRTTKLEAGSAATTHGPPSPAPLAWQPTPAPQTATPQATTSPLPSAPTKPEAGPSAGRPVDPRPRRRPSVYPVGSPRAATLQPSAGAQQPRRGRPTACLRTERRLPIAWRQLKPHRAVVTQQVAGTLLPGTLICMLLSMLGEQGLPWLWGTVALTVSVLLGRVVGVLGHYLWAVAREEPMPLIEARIAHRARQGSWLLTMLPCYAIGLTLAPLGLLPGIAVSWAVLPAFIIDRQRGLEVVKRSRLLMRAHWAQLLPALLTLAIPGVLGVFAPLALGPLPVVGFFAPLLSAAALSLYLPFAILYTLRLYQDLR